LSIDLTTPRTTEDDPETEKTDAADPGLNLQKNLETAKEPKNVRKKRKRVLRNGINNSDEEKADKSKQPSVSDFFNTTVNTIFNFQDPKTAF
jgi:hypothetical protein